MSRKKVNKCFIERKKVVTKICGKGKEKQQKLPNPVFPKPHLCQRTNIPLFSCEKKKNNSLEFTESPRHNGDSSSSETD